MERQDFMVNLRDMYSKVRELLDSPNANDLACKTEAIDRLKEIVMKLENELNESNKKDEQLKGMLATLWLDMGIVSTDMEELKTGEEYLMRCLDELKGKELSPHGILASISALNQLGIIWFKWNDLNKAEHFLKQAETQFIDYGYTKSGAPIGNAALFGIDDTQGIPSDILLEKLHTLTLYYLAQIYSVTNNSKSAEYCHKTLERQLNDTKLDHIEWALNAATLAQVFMEKQCFSQAKYHLSAATLMLRRLEMDLDKVNENGESSEEAEANKERFRHRSADVARCWAKYGILLMISSSERLIKSSESSQEEQDSNELSEEEKNLFEEKMKFDPLEEEIEPIAARITDKYLLDFNDARKVFLDIQHWLKEAQKYYTFESHASDHVQLVEDMSQAFKHLAFFEDNEERQAKMHKRRIDLLTSIVDELNPRYYQAECQQIWVELGETYSTILHIKWDKYRDTDPPPHAVTKINRLSESAIKYYQMFLESVKVKNSTDTKFTESMIRPALYAYFHLGRLYSKMIVSDDNVRLENVKKSLEAYQFFVNYCESSEELVESMKEELSMCKNLVQLLPLRIQKISQAIATKGT